MVTKAKKQKDLPVTKFVTEFKGGLRLETIYHTPTEESKWSVVAMLDDLVQMSSQDDFIIREMHTPDLDQMEHRMQYVEKIFAVERQDIIENGKIIPSFRAFHDKDEYCIHRHEGKLYPLYGMACAYRINELGIVDWDGPLRESAKKNEIFESLSSERDVYVFIQKHKYQDNLQDALTDSRSKSIIVPVSILEQLKFNK